MSTTERTGPGLLRGWRKESGRSQESLAVEVGVRQPSLCEWEAGSRRPELPAAIALEHISDGAVPIEAWGYARELVEQMRGVVARRDAAAA